MEARLELFNLLKVLMENKTAKVRKFYGKVSVIDNKIKQLNKEIAENQALEGQGYLARNEAHEIRNEIVNAENEIRTLIEARKDLENKEKFDKDYKFIITSAKRKLLSRKYEIENEIDELENRMDNAFFSATTPEYGSEVNRIYKAEQEVLNNRLESGYKMLSDINRRIRQITR